MINQQWLQTFCTLSEVGHFTQTAQKLFMTQSGVSQHINKLEKQLGCQLLIRQGKSFSLTATGRLLYEKGQRLLLSAQQLELEIKQDEPYSGVVKLASPGSVGLSLYPHLLTLQEKHHNLVIDYRFAPNNSIEADLLEHRLDLGLVTELSNSECLLAEKVTQEPLVVVTSSATKSIDWPTLAELGYISHPDGAYHCRQLLSQNFAEFKQIEQFQHKGFSNQISLILTPVSKGLGFTVLPLNAALNFQPRSAIKIHHLQNAVKENLYLCINTRSVQPGRVRLLKSVIRQYLHKSSQQL